MVAQQVQDLYDVADGLLNVSFHAGQTRAWLSKKRFVLVTAGTQSGKTSFGPFWLEREIREMGCGDYMIVTPTFQLLDLKALPEFLRYFEELMKYGTYKASPRRHFEFSKEGEIRMWGRPQTKRTIVWFGYADNPDSLESATLKGAWADECGQRKFKLSSWHALLRRLSLARGRVLLTTTPYNLGWLYTRLYLPWARGEAPDVDVINFQSIENPQFSKEEFERARRDLPKWQFDMLYRGLFTKPAGLIYDSFDRDRHLIPRFAIPAHWQRWMGVDFGAINTVAVFAAEEPQTRRMFVYKTYKGSKRIAKEHVRQALGADLSMDNWRREPHIPIAVGGSRSEIDYRNEWRAAGLPLEAPLIKEVEVGIDRVYGGHARNEILVFDDLDEYIEQKETYTRETDALGNVLETIEDKESFHYMDAERYMFGKRFSENLAGMASINRMAKPQEEDASYDRHGDRNDWY